MLDLNEMARGERFMAVGDLEVSDDGNLLAYTTDNVGFREYRLRVRDFSTGKDLAETVEKVSSLAWAADNKTLFYTVDDAAKRPYRLYRHALGSDPKNDALVYEEKDEMFRVDVHRSRSRRVLFLVSGSHTADEWRFLPADKPAGTFTMITPREKEHEYAVDHRGDLFYIRRTRAVATSASSRPPSRVPTGELTELPPPPAVGSGLNPSRTTPSCARARGRAAAHPRHRPATKATTASICGVWFRGRAAEQRGVRHPALPVRLPVLHDPAVGLRLRHGDEGAQALEAHRGPRRL
jgi:hypothetical protein